LDGRLGATTLAAVLALGAALVWLGESRTPDPLRRGAPAPRFELPVLGGGPSLSIESLRGKVVLLNFWATWCKPCEDEMPAMQRLYRELAPEGFELLAISVDEQSDAVARFQQRLGLSFPVLLDPKRRVADTYQSYKFPESWLIDADGVLVARFIGPRDWDSPAYVDRVRSLLAGGS
jgi:peroxiredoxin